MQQVLLDTARRSTIPTYKVAESTSGRDAHLLAASMASVDWDFHEETTGFLSHDIHPYPAKYIPQLAGQLISFLSSPGELIVDPFGGSGTTAFEALRLGRRATCVDANPLATLIGRVKTTPIDAEAEVDLKSIHAAALATAHGAPITWSPPLQKFVPDIPNIERWFSQHTVLELAFIRQQTERLVSPVARDIALLALSRIIVSVSFQDSETRYKSVPRVTAFGETLLKYGKAVEAVTRSLRESKSFVRYGAVRFVTSDFRTLGADSLPSGIADAIVTSPPYGNATDYHLYHRFRLFWLGFDPRDLAKVEIGSHLNHQRAEAGFECYIGEMRPVIEQIERILRPAGYAALVIGDSLYGGKTYSSSQALKEEAVSVGMEHVTTIKRTIHQHRRSFAGKRASTEDILILRKPCAAPRVTLNAPSYRTWPYEDDLRKREALRLAEAQQGEQEQLSVPISKLPEARRLAFTHTFSINSANSYPTWQAVLESSERSFSKFRKESKYATHGLHPYKGKYYPQLAKSLINISGIPVGGTILDPFCGSGTTLLEASLSGMRGVGCDLNPLAAKISAAKTGIINLDPDIIAEGIDGLSRSLEANSPADTSVFTEFPADCLDELNRWFSPKILLGIHRVLACIRRSSGGVLRDFLEVVLSSLIRDVSKQDPKDLRIRYRSDPPEDADVVGLFQEALGKQLQRLRSFWSVRSYAPHPLIEARAAFGDSRKLDDFQQLGITPSSVDLVLTSPPYATALPYIDTDRLSILAILGINASSRRPIEQALIGSREITTSERRRLSSEIDASDHLPAEIRTFLQGLQFELSKSNDGFRRQNMPALLLKFFNGMHQVIQNVGVMMKPGAELMMVIGDNKTRVGGSEVLIPTTTMLELLARQSGFDALERISIAVSTEDLLHIKNAITENSVIRLRKTH